MKKEIDRLVRDMRNGLEKPTKRIVDGKEENILEGEFMTIDAEPVQGDRAFIVCINDYRSYFIEIHEVLD